MKKQSQNNKTIKNITNIFLLLGVIVPFFIGCSRLDKIGDLDRITKACEATYDETDGSTLEKLAAVQECSDRNIPVATSSTNSAYTDCTISFYTSAIFVGFIFIYNKKS